MIFTRYLYPKHNVIYSLYVSLALADAPQSLFWAYELYFSGFRTETVELLLQIYEDYYANEPIKSTFQKWLTKIVEKWRQNMQPDIVDTIIQNMIRREPDFFKIREKIPDLGWLVTNESGIIYLQKPIFVISKETPAQYHTQPAEYTKAWKLPRFVCQYVSYIDSSSEPIKLADYENWLYSASGSPIWRTRIKKYGGKISPDPSGSEGGIVEFSSVETEEEFMNWFSMEPDEQPLEIQASWFGEPI